MPARVSSCSLGVPCSEMRMCAWRKSGERRTSVMEALPTRGSASSYPISSSSSSRRLSATRSCRWGSTSSGYNTFVKTAVFLLLLPAAWSQPLRVYSEFAKIDAAGKVTAPAEPREILSPAIARNAFSSFQVVVDVPQGTSYQLYVAQNPENSVEVTLYRENGEKLEGVEQPVSGNGTQVYWMDLWTARDAPVQRIKVEPQLHVNNDWVIYPMEARVVNATVSDGPRPNATDPIVWAFMCGSRRVYYSYTKSDTD